MSAYAARPEFVTFTGLDDRTNLDDCAALGARYPIEWATLVGGRLGKNRYPLKKLDEITVWDYERKAIHLCGAQAAQAQTGPRMLNRLSKSFRRIQVNRAKGQYDYHSLREWAIFNHVNDIVVQHRDKHSWPEDEDLLYLYDLSGGKGVLATTFPPCSENRLVGYAGGISPQNVEGVLRFIRAVRYWIDMESGVRDESDWLDINRCEEVCRAIWGK